jgi:hypothetical protein
VGDVLAARDLRADQPGGLRQHAVSYRLQALQLFRGIRSGSSPS